MNTHSENLVDLVRQFMAAYEELRGLFARYRSGELAWSDVDPLIGDSDRSVLFRLKERCHALFRDSAPTHGSMRREALLDLAVGSLFHEAMKFRESFYQREVYGPKVRALRRETSDEADALFREFEKILAASSVRIDEALLEAETLLAQTRDQLRRVLGDFRQDGLTARYLVDHAPRVARVFETSVEALLAEIHGDAAEGFATSALARLRSGHFRLARADLDEALRCAPGREDLRRLVHYAEGMEAFRRGRWADAVAALGAWVEAGPARGDEDRVRWTLGALTRMPPLLELEERRALEPRVRALAERLEARAAGAPHDVAEGDERDARKLASGGG